MQSTLPSVIDKSWWRSLALAAVALAPLAAGAMTVHASQPVRVVACNVSSLSPTLVVAGVNVVAPNPADSEDDSNDRIEEQQQPKIVGSIAKPRGVSEDDSKKLASLNLATISRDQAIESALGAVADRSQRTVTSAALEGENGYLVWAVKTVLSGSPNGPDPKLEAKVDAGEPGDVLSIECDPDDD